MHALIDTKDFEFGFIGNNFIGVGASLSGFGFDSVFERFNFGIEGGNIISEFFIKVAVIADINCDIFIIGKNIESRAEGFTISITERDTAINAGDIIFADRFKANIVCGVNFR